MFPSGLEITLGNVELIPVGTETWDAPEGRVDDDWAMIVAGNHITVSVFVPVG